MKQQQPQQLSGRVPDGFLPVCTNLQLCVSLFALTCVYSAGGELLTGVWPHNSKGDGHLIP